MTLDEALVAQAMSDHALASRLRRRPVQAEVFCQVASKCQQAVEKATKGVVERLNRARLLTIDVGRAHEVTRLVDALVRTQFGPVSAELNRIYTRSVRATVRELDQIVPTYPAKGTLARRNHEYPYQPDVSTWRAPSAPDAFYAGEIKRWFYASHRITVGVQRIVAAVDRLW